MKIASKKLLLVIVALFVLLGLNITMNDMNSSIIETPTNKIENNDSIDSISFKEIHDKLDTIEKRIKRNWKL